MKLSHDLFALYNVYIWSFLMLFIDFKRPKNLLVFVNPYGGKRQGPSIYHDKIAPLFELADIKTEVISKYRS